MLSAKASFISRLPTMHAADHVQQPLCLCVACPLMHTPICVGPNKFLYDHLGLGYQHILASICLQAHKTASLHATARTVRADARAYCATCPASPTESAPLSTATVAVLSTRKETGSSFEPQVCSPTDSTACTTPHHCSPCGRQFM